MFLRSQCCCDEGGEGAQCVFRDDFDFEDLRYDAVNSSGDSADDVFVTRGGSVDAVGSGSYTIRLHPNPPEYIEAETVVRDNSGETVESGTGDISNPVSSGVTIRRADSSGNVSLVRVWGTTGGYELRLGGSVVSSFTTSGKAKIRLSLEKDGMGGWNALAYVDGVLQHTETGIGFTKPADLNVGLIAEGGGEFEYLKLSPCPVDGRCPDTIECADFTLPVSWTINISGTITGENEFCPDSPAEEIMLGEINLLSSSRTSLVTYLGEEDYFIWADTGLQCSWTWIQDSQNDSDNDDLTLHRFRVSPLLEERVISPERWPDKVFNACARQGGSEYTSDLPNDEWISSWDTRGFGTVRPLSSGFWQVGFSATPAFEPGPRQISFVATMFISFNDFDAAYARARYRSGGFTEDEAPDFTKTPVELTLDTTSDFALGGTFPSTITMTPNSEKLSLVRQITGGCGSRCEPQLYPFGTLIASGDVGGTPYCGLFGTTFNEDTFSWEFSASPIMDEADACGNDSFSLAILCEERNEGEGRKWWAVVEGTGTGSSVVTYLEAEVLDGENFSLQASGPVDIGCGSVPFLLQTSRVDLDNLPFMGCCTENETLKACLGESIPIEVEFIDMDGHNCSSSIGQLGLNVAELFCDGTSLDDILPGFDHSDGYYLGAIPITPDANARLIVWCDGSEFQMEVLQEENDCLHIAGIDQTSVTRGECLFIEGDWTLATEHCGLAGQGTIHIVAG